MADSTGEIDVRLAGQEHIDALAGFNLAMAKETEGRELDADVLRSGVAAVLDHPEHGFYVVAERDGRTLGGLLGTYEWSDWRDALFWWIQSVYVAPDYRRQGVYSALHGYVAEEAQRRGVCGLRLYVDKDNRAAQQVYASLGMSPTHYDLFEVEFD